MAKARTNCRETTALPVQPVPGTAKEPHVHCFCVLNTTSLIQMGHITDCLIMILCDNEHTICQIVQARA